MNDKKNTSQKSPPLYHYTTQDGLLGIIESKSLWFTNILYLNDASEFNYIFNLVQDQIKSKGQNALRAYNYPNESLIVEFLQDALTDKNYAGVLEYCVFSFSKVEDQLSQWRGYCGDVSGYCIEFDSDRILNYVNRDKNILEMVECLYNEDKQQKRVQEMIDKAYGACDKQHVVDVIQKYLENRGLAIRTHKLSTNESDILSTIRLNFFTEVFYNAPIFKHPKYYEEEEMRLIAIYSKTGVHKTLFRTSKSMLIPYHKIKIAKDTAEIPINKIIVGPTNHPELAKGAVENLLLANSIDCKVELSEIPYRA